MPYDPQIHIPIDKPLGIAQAIPSDARSYFYDAALLKYRPYQSTAEVNAYITIAKFRKGNFSVFINSTGALQLDGSFIGGTVDEYWYRDGVLNANLVSKTTVATTDLSKLKGYTFRIVGSAVSSFTNAEWVGATFLDGRRSGGDIFLDDDPNFIGYPDAWNFNPGTGTLTPPNDVEPDESGRFLFKNVSI